ncbi:MAG TPA: hypothetical protein VKO84_06400 [Gaiellaceae bacterium]|nr:hypothetical protein [Gaiellaceae bacterium]
MVDVRSPSRRVARAVPVLCVAALLTVFCAGTAVAAVTSSSSHASAQSKLGGKWKGQYSGAFSGHFTLHWKQTGTKLSGSITLSSPKGKYGISGSVHHSKIKFGAVGVGATYKGTWKASKMSGSWNSPQGGGSWSAHKVS